MQSGPDAFDKSRFWYDIFNYVGSYWYIMWFQISSTRENRQRDIRVIKIRVLRKACSKQLCFIRCRRQLGATELYFRFRRFMLLVEMKKVVSMNYGSSTSSWKSWRWVRLGLILSMRDIYINSNLNPLTKFTSSSRSTEFKDSLPPMEHLSNDDEDRPSQQKNSYKLCNKKGIPLWIW